ncbi:TPA: RHS repeat domain-containing protein, partial [Pseudomonas aeruginosa]
LRQKVGPWQSDYQHDANGNIQQHRHSLWGTLDYQYDPLDRLTEERGVQGGRSYAYDAVGNRTQRSDNPASGGTASSQDYQYAPDSNRLTAIGAQAVTSDAAGNLTQDRAARKLAYDAQGRLQSVSLDGQQVAEYRYNALGQRIVKLTPESVTTYLYGPDGQLLGEAEHDGSGRKLRAQYYLWLDSLPLATIDADYDAQGKVGNPTLLYLHGDHLDTPRLATDASGQIAWQWQSDAFGRGEALSQGSTQVNLRFPGQYYDAESGLHYNYFRDYDPETGRYVESDPIGLDGGLNTYAYVGSNPVGLVDPNGLSPTATAGAGAGFVVGGPPGAVVGGLIGLGLGVWGANAAWDAYHDEASEGGSASVGTSPGTAAEKARERKEYSRICKTPIPPTGDQCKDAKANLERLQQCLALRENFSKKWFNDNDAGHVTEINNTRQAIENLKDFLRRVCGEQCN